MPYRVRIEAHKPAHEAEGLALAAMPVLGTVSALLGLVPGIWPLLRSALD
jgi:hypothetical protein